MQAPIAIAGSCQKLSTVFATPTQCKRIIRAETITYRSKAYQIKGRLHGGALIRTCKACSIGAHYDMYLLLHHVLTSNPLGFLTDIVAEAYDLACAVDVRHWWSFSRRLPFLGRPTGRFATVSTCPRSLDKNDEASCSSLLMALKNRVTLAIALVLCTTRLRVCTCDRS